MIGIQNLGRKNRRGEHKYRLFVNEDTLVLFEHRREDGIAACLRKAAEAIESKRIEEAIKNVQLGRPTPTTAANGSWPAPTATSDEPRPGDGPTAPAGADTTS